MTKANSKGGKNRRKGKSIGMTFKREISYPAEDQVYGWVEKVLGDRRVLCKCSDDKERVCHIRGKFNRRVWITSGDLLILSVRDFQEEKADVVHKYNHDEFLFLKEQDELSFLGDVTATPEGNDDTDNNDLEINLEMI